MNQKEIDQLLADSRRAYGSASPERLGALLERLVAAVIVLLAMIRRKDDELAMLRTKVFGSVSEKGHRAAGFVEDAATAPAAAQRDDIVNIPPEMTPAEKAALEKKVKRPPR